MKLRIKGNLIRLRLGQSEVRRMRDEGIVEESTTFGIWGRQRLDYALCTGPNLLAVTASFDDGRIIVRVPAALMQDWARTDQVGIESIQEGGDGSTLKILIEKDFECIEAPRDESQEDSYPHPQLSAACAAGKSD
jgi:hypothetical protein